MCSRDGAARGAPIIAARSKALAGKEGEIRVWVCSTCPSHCSRQRRFLNTNHSTWGAAGSPQLLLFPSAGQNYGEGSNDISAACGFSQKCQTLNKAQ